jgi:hypothetical protein
MDDQEGLNFLGFVDASTPEDVCTALAILNGGVADFLRYTAEQRKQNSATPDSSDALDLCTRAILRCLRDGRLRRQLVYFWNEGVQLTKEERNSIYGKFISDH